MAGESPGNHPRVLHIFSAIALDLTDFRGKTICKKKSKKMNNTHIFNLTMSSEDLFSEFYFPDEIVPEMGAV